MSFLADLFVVADGMGGHKGGAQAAHMTVEGFEKHLRGAPSDWPLSQALQEASRRTNEEVYQRAHIGDPDTESMGSTVVVALVADGTVHIRHVGDSRAYLYRHGRLIPLTRDHTEVQKMVDAGMLTPTEARDHPDGHILTRAIGARPEAEMEIGESRTLENGDALLLCSDGLSGFVKDDAIRQVLERQPDVQRVPGDLVALALAAGANDNITIQSRREGYRSSSASPDSRPEVPVRRRPRLPSPGSACALERCTPRQRCVVSTPFHQKAQRHDVCGSPASTTLNSEAPSPLVS